MGAEAKSDRRKHRVGWALTVGVVVVLLLLLTYGLRGRAIVLEERSAPDFTISLFDGSQFSLGALRGQVVLVNFWASWCKPCRDEAPVLEKTWQTYQARGVAMVGITVKDVSSKSADWVEQMGITYPNGADPYGRIADAYGITGIPETYIIARDGKIKAHFVGPVTEARLGAALDKALQAP